MKESISVLDHGYVRFIERWGSDERIIESARMSTAKGFLGWGPTHVCPDHPEQGDLKWACLLCGKRYTPLPDVNYIPSMARLLVGSTDQKNKQAGMAAGAEALTEERAAKMRATTDLRNWLGFLTLRMALGAQWEIRQYANAVGEMSAERFPRTWELFVQDGEIGGV